MDAVRGDYALEFSHRGDQDHVKCSASVTYRAVYNERIVRFSQHSLQQTWSERLRLREGTGATGTRAKYFPKSHTVTLRIIWRNFLRVIWHNWPSSRGTSSSARSRHAPRGKLVNLA